LGVTAEMPSPTWLGPDGASEQAIVAARNATMRKAMANLILLTSYFLLLTSNF
jgi:hypothetical protein